MSQEAQHHPLPEDDAADTQHELATEPQAEEEPSLHAEEEALAFEESYAGDEEVDPQIAELQAKVMEQHEHMLRMAAEMDNLRKRTQREKEEASKYGIQKFAKELAQVAENLIRAVHSVSEEDRLNQPAVKTLAEGVEMTLQALLKAFAAEQIERLHPEGEAFDHRYHQAISQVDVPGAQPGQVVQVVQAGYRLHDRLLQPALVIVARGETVA